MMNAPSGREHVVKKSKFTEEQIAFSLKQADLGTRFKEVCRKMGMRRPSTSGRSAPGIAHRADVGFDLSVRLPTHERERRIKEITDTRVHHSYRRVHVMLRREGHMDNVERGYRLYREEGLSLRLKRSRRNKAAQRR